MEPPKPPHTGSNASSSLHALQNLLQQKERIYQQQIMLIKQLESQSRTPQLNPAQVQALSANTSSIPTLPFASSSPAAAASAASSAASMRRRTFRSDWNDTSFLRPDSNWSMEEIDLLKDAIAKHPFSEDASPHARCVHYSKLAAAVKSKSAHDVLQKLIDDYAAAPASLGTGVPAGSVLGSVGTVGGASSVSESERSDLERGVQRCMQDNIRIIARIRDNLVNGRLEDNFDLMVQFRSNVSAILTRMSQMGGVMSQMPAIPVRLNTLLIPSKHE